MNKSDYRNTFNSLQYLIKFNSILKACNVDSGAFARFCNGQDNAISIEKVKAVYDALGVLLITSHNV